MRLASQSPLGLVSGPMTSSARSAVCLKLLVMAGLVLPGWLIGGAGTETARLSPVALAAAPDGRTLFVACAGAGRLLVFDTVTRRIRAAIDLPVSQTVPESLIFSPRMIPIASRRSGRIDRDVVPKLQ